MIQNYGDNSISQSKFMNLKKDIGKLIKGDNSRPPNKHSIEKRNNSHTRASSMLPLIITSQESLNL